MRYKDGDNIKIIGNKSLHGFEIGQVVKVINVNEEDNSGLGEYVAQQSDGEWWFIHPKDVEGEYDEQ